MPRTSRITKLDGKVVFEAKDVMVPDFWSQVAVDILAQKYFRRKGIDAQNNGETDSRQVFHRLAGCWRHWGETHGYFDSAEDAQAFYDELVYMLAKQMCAPNSPPVVQHGPSFSAYASPAAQVPQPTWIPAPGRLVKSTSAYERPQPHACFIQSVADDLVNEAGSWTCGPVGPHLQVRLRHRSTSPASAARGSLSGGGRAAAS